MSFPFADVKEAIDGIRSRLKLAPNTQLQGEFDAGLHPNLLSYQKLQTGSTPLPALEKYIVGATSYLHQPSNYYDIFAAGRCVIIVQLLESALTTLHAKQINGLTERVSRLVRAVDLDAFDSTVFELITAARYALVPTVNHIEFVDGKPKQTPDILFSRDGVDSFVECKKVNRVKDFSIATRKVVRESLDEVVANFRRQGISVLAEVSFNCDPKLVSPSELFEACQAAIENRTAIVTSQLTVKAALLPKFKGKGYTLYPSPGFLWTRYGHRVRSDWFGIVHHVLGKHARRADLPKDHQGGMSSWLKSVEWDAAIKWKITAKDVVGKYRRFAFDGLFEAIGQIGGAGLDSTVHLWLETDYSVGGRHEALLDFFGRLSANRQQNVVGWIVINETLIDVSPKGRFDLVEHAHMIQGPTATGPHPVVSRVFGISNSIPSIAQFGVGHELPDIDDD